MTIAHIPDHATQALDRLAEQFRGKPNLAAIINADAAQIQAIEDALHSLIAGRSLKDGVGKQLDEIGAIVGQPRSVAGPDATDDDAYRALLYGRIMVNTSEGDPERVYALLRQLGATAAYLREPGRYGLLVQYLGTLLVGDADLVRLIELATGPVALQITEYEAGFFGFAGNPGALGFGEGQLARSIDA